MGRGKHCSAEKREIIKKMILEGKTYAEIGSLLGCSNKMIRNAITFVEKDEKRGRKPVMSQLLVKRLVRQSRKEPFKPATELKKNYKYRHALRQFELAYVNITSMPVVQEKFRF